MDEVLSAPYGAHRSPLTHPVRQVKSERAATGKSKCNRSQLRVSPEEALPENYSNLTWPLKRPSSQIGKFQVDRWISCFEHEMHRIMIVCYHSYNGKHFQALRNHIDACI